MVSLSLLLFPACPDLLIEDITLESKTVIISVRSTKTSVQCPACARPSAKIHSRYVRVPADLPWMEYGVRLHLEVRHFFCQHEDCSRKTFAEPFPDLVQAHARRTTRQAQLLQEVAFADGVGKPERLEQGGGAVLRVVTLYYVCCVGVPYPPHPFLACLVWMTGPGAKDAGTEPFSAIWSDMCRWICCRTATRTRWRAGSKSIQASRSSAWTGPMTTPLEPGVEHLTP